MKHLLATLFLCLSSLVALAADIASVNFDAIKDDLREYYFTKPENAAVKKEYDASAQQEERHMKDMEKMVTGGKPLDLKSVGVGAASHYKLKRQIEGELKKELYRLISGLGLKYELIYDASNAETIIYAKSQVDDVTTIVRQAIVDLAAKK